MLGAIASFLHFVCAFGVFFTLIFEKIIFKKKLSYHEVRLLQTADKYYGISALLVLIIGFVRVFYFEKGSDFYFSNPFFHLKLSLFALIGLLSIYPTILFLRWNKIPTISAGLELEPVEYKRIKRLLNVEVVLIVLLLLSASFMASGIFL